MLKSGRGGVTQMRSTGDGRDLQHNYSDHHHQPSTGHFIRDYSHLHCGGSTTQQFWNIQIRTPFLCLSFLRVLRTTVEIPEIFWFSPPTGYSPSNVSSHYFYSPRWKTRTIKSFTAHIKQINLMETTVLTLVVMAARRLEALWLILSTHFMTEAD